MLFSKVINALFRLKKLNWILAFLKLHAFFQSLKELNKSHYIVASWTFFTEFLHVRVFVRRPRRLWIILFLIVLSDCKVEITVHGWLNWCLQTARLSALLPGNKVNFSIVLHIAIPLILSEYQIGLSLSFCRTNSSCLSDIWKPVVWTSWWPKSSWDVSKWLE